MRINNRMEVVKKIDEGRTYQIANYIQIGGCVMNVYVLFEWVCECDKERAGGEGSACEIAKRGRQEAGKLPVGEYFPTASMIEILSLLSRITNI